MNRHIRHAMALALTVLAIPAGPARAEPLYAHAGLARYSLAANQGAFLDWLDPVSAQAFSSAMGGDHGELGDWWSQLLVGAVQLRREDGDLAETLWFNPLFDAGLATRWERSGDRWIATVVVPVTGEVLRGEPVSLQPVLPTGNFRAAAEALAARTWPAAQQASWLGVDQTGLGTAVLRRIGAARAGLNGLRAAPGYESAGVMARTALVTGDESALPEPVRRALHAMGADARLTLRPVSGYPRADGWTMALQSPDAPMLAWLVHFADPAAAGEPASIAGYQMLNLGGAR